LCDPAVQHFDHAQCAYVENLGLNEADGRFGSIQILPHRLRYWSEGKSRTGGDVRKISPVIMPNETPKTAASG